MLEPEIFLIFGLAFCLVGFLISFINIEEDE